jgi:hypothetical protein
MNGRAKRTPKRCFRFGLNQSKPSYLETRGVELAMDLLTVRWVPGRFTTERRGLISPARLLTRHQNYPA